MSLELELDKLLKIKTSGRDDSNSNLTNFPYEPTPYSVLQELSNTLYISKQDKIIDYGCGKGRVDFFLAYYNKAKMIGVEYDLRLFNKALENHSKAISSNRVEFVNCCASKYEVPDDVTGAYFFNPFSIKILKDVIINIKKSKERNNREIKLFFYYPSKEYLEFISQNEDIVHLEDIDCMNLFKNKDKKEYIAIYKI